jgi:flagellar hook-length control protein FliK
MQINNKIDKSINNESKLKENNIDNNNNKLEQDFQKEIDKKINNQEKKDKKEPKEDNIENVKDQQSEKSKLKDLTDLKLFVLPYINKDLLSINLKQSLDLDEKNLLYIQRNPEKLENLKQENILKNENQLLKTAKKIDNSKEDYININAFEKFEKLYNSLKEISKEEKIKESKIIQQLVDNINIKELENKKLVEININKEIFGNLKVHILNEDNRLIILFKTDSKYALDLLKNNVNELKSMLKNRNLVVDNVKVEYEEEAENK